MTGMYAAVAMYESKLEAAAVEAAIADRDIRQHRAYVLLEGQYYSCHRRVCVRHDTYSGCIVTILRCVAVSVSVCLCAWLFRVPSAIHAYRQQLGAHDAVQANERAIARLSEVITRRIKTTNTRAMALAAKAADLRRQIDDERREIVRGGWSRRQYGATVHCSGGRSSCICTCVHVGCRAVVVADAVA